LDVKKERKLAENVSKPKSIVKTKEPVKEKALEKTKKVEKAATTATKKKPNRLAKFWRSTIGELRKVSWPTTQEAWRLTKVVLLVLFLMAVLLGVMDFAFSRGIAALVSL
jgi:preprotein translocase subunit SecE